jgi:nucleoside-diphosphate-sugar epimerase
MGSQDPAARLRAPAAPRRPQRIAVTGASGLIGRHLCDHFRHRGWEVHGLVRDPGSYPFTEPGIRLFRCDLPEVLERDGLAGANVLVHCAYSTRAAGQSTARQVNEDGTRRVLDAARAAGIQRFVFMSSLSAHDTARSYYGRSKHVLESLLDPQRDLVVRPGLVLASDGGLFHRMRQLVRRTPIVPLLGGGGQIVQTVHIDELCTAIERALSLGIVGRLNVAEPTGIAVKDLLHQIARQDGRRRYVISVPLTPVLLGLRLLEKLRLPLPISSENVLGLAALRIAPVEGDLNGLGMRLRTAAENLAVLATRD